MRVYRPINGISAHQRGDSSRSLLAANIVL
jgi:hypothetical protein